MLSCQNQDKSKNELIRDVTVLNKFLNLDTFKIESCVFYFKDTSSNNFDYFPIETVRHKIGICLIKSSDKKFNSYISTLSSARYFSINKKLITPIIQDDNAIIFSEQTFITIFGKDVSTLCRYQHLAAYVKQLNANTYIVIIRFMDT